MDIHTVQTHAVQRSPVCLPVCMCMCVYIQREQMCKMLTTGKKSITLFLQLKGVLK